MERLIRVIKVRGESVVVYTKGKYGDTTAGGMRNEDIRNVMKRLHDYEGTGITPEKIMELKERDTAKVGGMMMTKLEKVHEITDKLEDIANKKLAEDIRKATEYRNGYVQACEDFGREMRRMISEEQAD